MNATYRYCHRSLTTLVALVALTFASASSSTEKTACFSRSWKAPKSEGSLVSARRPDEISLYASPRCLFFCSAVRTRVGKALWRLLLLIGMLVTPPALAANPIHVRTTGSGTQCWVLLHPLGMSGRFWDRRAQLIADRYHVRVYAPDLPSHGRSAIVPRFDYDRSATAVAASLHPTCPSPEMIIGASSGGIVAMKLAARGKAKVVVIGVGWSFTEDNLRQLEEQSHSNASQEKYLRAYAEQGEAQVTALFESFNDLAKLGTRPFFNKAERRGLSDRLLILAGSNDQFFRPDSVERLHLGIRGSKLHMMNGAEHLGPLMEPFASKSFALIDHFATAQAEEGQPCADTDTKPDTRP